LELKKKLYPPIEHCEDGTKGEGRKKGDRGHQRLIFKRDNSSQFEEKKTRPTLKGRKGNWARPPSDWAHKSPSARIGKEKEWEIVATLTLGVLARNGSKLLGWKKRGTAVVGD